MSANDYGLTFTVTGIATQSRGRAINADGLALAARGLVGVARRWMRCAGPPL